jgi:ATP-dependent DNA helicase RecG
VHLSSSILELYQGKKAPESVNKLIQAGKNTIEDLIWTFPTKVYPSPVLTTLNCAFEGQLFRSQGRIINIKSNPSYTAKGKRGIRLFNITAIIQDETSIFTLRWFNSYPNFVKNIKTLDYIKFEGEVSSHGAHLQVINPVMINDQSLESNQLTITYPTINGVTNKFITNIINKIPSQCWEMANQLIQKVITNNQLNNIFNIVHGKVSLEEWSEAKYLEAKDKLIYYEFFIDQIKILIRKNKVKARHGVKVAITPEVLEESIKLHPFNLTEDQLKSLNDISNDILSGHSMMRMIQGDVGCGKTAIAISTCYFFLKEDFQCALMAPTETLARQHFNQFQKCLGDKFNIELLLGSHTSKEKKNIYQRLENNETALIIGTHSLFQIDVKFHNLALAIIDEQHKFGVNQRIKLLNKGKNTHCLIMTATPIPRTLRLTQYGDLDISTITQLPSSRKGIKTRIVTNQTEALYLSFIKTRLELNEQVFIVVPAIEESANLELKNIAQIYEKYHQIFKQYKIATLHGKMKSDDKDQTIQDFTNKKISILISTSVIEVGIDIPNATVISIYGADRFGLSSLHQLRGRVGRGNKTGFCFLMAIEPVATQSMERLKVLEKSTDGFYIAEKDLEFRGEGDLFGTEQAGQFNHKKLANVFYHRKIFDQVIQDFNSFIRTSEPIVEELMEKYINDDTLTNTI